MRRIIGYILAAAAVFAALCSCEPAPQEEIVPEGVLRIFADRTSIAADGADCVTFKVMFGSKDVSNAPTMKIVRTANGKEQEMVAGANVFSTTAPGTYTFKATLYSSGDHVSDNEVTVNASEVKGQKAYMQKVLGEQFTSVGCTSCPHLSTAIKAIQQERPGLLVPISFHMDFQMSDPMAIPATTFFYEHYGFQGLPFFNLNLRKTSRQLTSEKSLIIEAIDEELEAYPSTCGVAIETEFDASSRELRVVSKVTSNVAVRHKYHIFLVEDGIEYMQSGSSEAVYVHDNVVRQMVAPGITGFNMNGKQPFTPGVEVTAENTVKLDKGWNEENMRVVVVAMVSLDGELTYTCNNVNECKVGESVGYVLDK